ncbi:Pentatricopeptide repeat-containing protein [Phytophthora nicotianae]|uniref:Pentatricopeptide repeat-containing protein n=2 Tax=Phytophthora nicotianae TaxID=4792 RepID=A0A0W8CBE1_PHYNI|nr:Pentatricopeptide repeat-containing protein [Phytophthora nicotianae]
MAGAQVMAFRRGLLRRICNSSLAGSLSASSRDAVLSVEGLHTRQFAVLVSNDGQEARHSALQRLAEASNLSWRLRAAVKDVEHSLPSERGRRFYNRRVVEALEQGDLNRAWAVVETLHRRHPERAVLWPFTYNLLLRHYCRQQKTLVNANLTRILALLDVMMAQGCADQKSFQVAMAACSRARHLRSARHVLEKMEESGREPDDRIYGFLINCCARKQGLVNIAEGYFDEMLAFGIKPTILVINAMLRVYSRDSGRSEVMLELVKRARDEFGLVPNTVMTRTIVYYLLCEGAVNGAVKYLRGVEKEFPRAETIMLPLKRQVVNSLADACRQRGDWDAAEFVLGLVKRTDEEDTFVTDVERDARNTLKLEGLIAKRDVISPPVVWALDEQDWTRMTPLHQEAFFRNRSQEQSLERAVERMHLHTPAPKTDRSIQKQSLKLEGKLHLLDEMIRAKNASANDFNAVLGACGRQGQLADAVSVLTKMKKYAESSMECAPTTWSYNALLNACAVRGDIHEIETIVNEMLDNDVNPDQVTMNTVIKAHTTSVKNGVNGSSQTRLNTVMQALSFFEWCTEDQKLDSEAGTYYSLFRLFATYLESPEDNSTTGVEVDDDDGMDDVEEKDEDFIIGQEGELVAWMSEFITSTCRDAPLVSLDIGVFNNAFDYYHRLGDVDESFALFNLMKKRGFQPDDTTLGLMFATCATQQQFDVGLSFLDHLMTNDGYKPTLKVLSGAMQLCANSKNPDGALELFRAIETSGAFTPTIETYEPVVFAYARVGNVTSAWEIANEMEEKLGRVSISIYNRILLACVEAALPGRALEVLGIIRHKDGVAPDIISYNTALEAFVRSGERAAWWRKNNINQGEDEDADYEENYSEEAELENDDSGKIIETEDAAVGPTLSIEQREKATWARASVIDLLQDMQRSRVKPDITTYERAIAVCSVNEDSEGVIAIFDRLIDRDRGKDAVNLKSDLVSDSSFTAYLVACTSLQDNDRVVEAPILLHKWHTATGQVPPEFVVTQLLDSLEVLGEWCCAVRMLPNWQAHFGVAPSVQVFNKVMQMCNQAEEHHLVAPIFATMQDSTAYRVYPDAESYIQRIYAEEQRENWVVATDLFVEMQKRFPSEEISHQQLQKVALGRYRLRQNEH